ncbi:hypothetical protein FISHEDRAFT_41718 [Fistulina hepatica ATCC 64428]|nr:hypothetical protein FISHEDRAFT_41718 [Fistulina hepatica ATCC 64428]
MSSHPSFDETAILSYLKLDASYEPSPLRRPVEFLLQHIRNLPPHLLVKFADVTDPKQRSKIAIIRNRRNQYTKNNPPELQFSAARSIWPYLWDGRDRPWEEEGVDERRWVQQDFLPGQHQHVNGLAQLLGGYEEERQAERVRIIRRERGALHTVLQHEPVDEIVEEEEDSSDEDSSGSPLQPETDAYRQATFERMIRERFIDGLLDAIDYNTVDWDESLDSDVDHEVQEQWFDDDDGLKPDPAYDRREAQRHRLLESLEMPDAANGDYDY